MSLFNWGEPWVIDRSEEYREQNKMAEFHARLGCLVCCMQGYMCTTVYKSWRRQKGYKDLDE